MSQPRHAAPTRRPGLKVRAARADARSMRVLGRSTALGLGLVVAVGLVAPAAMPASAASVPSSFAFVGGGWGHGVGMSQYGALGQASEGRSANEILRHYYTGTKVAGYADNHDIAVNLLNQVSSLRVRSQKLVEGGGGISLRIGGTTITGNGGDVFTFTASNGRTNVLKNGVAKGSASAVDIRISGTRYPSTTPRDDSKATLFRIASGSASFSTTSNKFRYGSFRVVARGSGSATRLVATNNVRLHDEYLLGIGEMPSSWPAAALQAQAIAARSYAKVKYNAGFKGGCQCHVDSGKGPYYDQMFVGYSKESGSYGAAWRSAVLATATSGTAGRMVLYKGKPAQAFYSSSTGGRTQNVRDVWGSSVPYLVSVDDRWSTQAKYNPTFASWGPHSRSQAQLRAAFGLKDVARLDLSRRNASGALSTAVATASGGKQASLSAGAFVSRLGLTSNWVRLAGDRAATAAKPATATTVVTKRKVPKGKKRLVRAFVRTSSGAALTNRKVTFTWNPKGPKKRTFVRRTNDNGAARIRFSYGRPTNVKARFAGGPNYTASKQRVRVTVKR